MPALSGFDSPSNSAKQDQMKIGKQVQMWDNSEIASYYGKYADAYDKEIEQDFESYPGPFIIGKWVTEWFLSKRDRKLTEAFSVLDLGCGTGQSGVPFVLCKEQQFKLVGLDTTPEMLKQAEKRGYNELLAHDLEVYPYPDVVSASMFDAVVCVGVMDFIRDPTTFLSYSRTLLRGEQSVLGITLPEQHDHSDLSSFSENDMRSLFQKTGFKVERHERFMGYKDSKSGMIQYYHGWILTPSSF